MADCTNPATPPDGGGNAPEWERVRLAAIIAGTQAGTWEWNVQTGEALFNERWAQTIGYTLSELAPLSIDTWLRALHPDDLETSRSILHRHFAGELDCYEYECRMLHKDGRWVWVHDRGRLASRTEAGEPLWMFGAHQDITERKHAEEALWASEMVLQSLLDSTAEAIYGLDLEGKCTFCNLACLRMTGYSSQDQLLGQNMHDILHHSTREGRRLRCEESRIFNAFRVGVASHADDEVIWRADGACFAAEYWAFPQRRAGRLVGAVVTFVDITGRKQAERELRETVARLEATNAALEEASRLAECATRAKSEFLANMSHEIRTPMTAILGFSDLLMSQQGLESLSPEHTEALATIHRNGRYLLEIINDILDLSKIEAGKLVVEQRPCRPAELVDDVVGLMQVRADAKGLALSSEFEGSLPETICTDPTRLRQILINLLGNAVKFTEGGQVRLVVRSLPPGGGSGRLQFDVIDTGIGMTDAQQARLFQPFMQAESATTRKYGGTGLGLAISKRLAEMLGGSIAVQSVVGRGSTFRLTIGAGSALPGDAPDHLGDDLPPRKFAAVTCGPIPENLDCRVLLAEDGPDNQRLLSLLLRKAKVALTLVENGRDAMETALAARGEGRPFDLILMDMQMPVMDGYEATRRLREAGYGGPIVALTASTMSGDEDACRRAGCDDYVSKPIDRGRLYAVVASHARRTDSAPKAAAIDAADPSAAAPCAAPPAAKPAAPRVLLAEDTPDIRWLVVAMLDGAGIPVATATNGQEAVQSARQALHDHAPYDVILMDMQMPTMDGYSATAQLRREGYRGRIVALTAHAMAGDREKCLAAGCDDYLTKPIQLDRLIEALRVPLPAAAANKGATPPAAGHEEELAETDVLRSLYADRPVVRRLLRQFVGSLNERVEAIHAAAAEGRSDDLRRLAHQLKGAAGSYGYPSLTGAAGWLEEHAADGGSQLSCTISRIDALCRAIARGCDAPETSACAAGPRASDLP